MKRTLMRMTVLLMCVFCAAMVRAEGGTYPAQGASPASTQATCTASATLLYSTTQSGGATPYGRLSLTFQNQSAQPVYIAPRSDISTSNAGVLLPQYSSFTTDRTSGNVSWYCVTSSGSATVGITEEK